MDIKRIKTVGGGVLLGAVNGLFGGGGGMVAVPVLSSVLDYERKQAHATAILIIAPVCLLSAVIYILNGYTDVAVLVPSILGNVAGGLLGARFLGKLPKICVQAVFVLIMFVAGIRTVIG